MIKDMATSFTGRYPWIGIAAILIITFASIGAMILKPMEEAFDTEDFLPDIDVAQANSIYQDRFTTSYYYIVLVREGDTELITPGSFHDIILLSNEIQQSDTYQEYRDHGSQDDYPLSPASAMFNMHNAVSSLENIRENGNFLSTLVDPTGGLTPVLDNLTEDLGSDDLNDGQITNISSEIIAEIDDYMDISVPDRSGNEQMEILEYYDSFEDTSSFHDEILNLLSYDPANTDIQNATGQSMVFGGTVAGTIHSLSSSISAIDTVVSEGNLSSSSAAELGDLKGYLEELEDRLSDLSGIASSSGNPLMMGQLTQSFFIGQYTFTNFFTKDFDPGSGAIYAEGLMVFVSLDTSLYELEEDDPEGLMDIEKNISKIVNTNDDGSDLSIHPLAFAVISDKINEASNESMQILLPAAMLFVLVILSLIYRNVFDIILNVLALVFAIIWMYGFGSLMGYSSNPMITAVPVLLVGLGIDYGIHLTMRYREEVRKGNTVRESLKAMSGSVGTALFLATFTTVFAFMSNVISPISLIMQFGVMAAVGIMASFIIMLVFVPSVKRLRDVRRAAKKKTLFLAIKEGECDICDVEKANKRFPNKAILGMTSKAEKHPAIILIFVGLITVGMLSAGLNLEVTFDVNDFLPDNLQESRDIGYLIDEFSSGSGDTGILIIEGDVSDPEVLRAMSQTMDLAVSIDSEYILTEGTGESERPKADFVLYAMKDTVNQVSVLDPQNPFISEYSAAFDTSSGLPLDNATSEDVKDVMDIFYSDYPSLAKRVIHKEGDEFTSSAIAFTVSTEDDDDAWVLYDELREIDDPIEKLEGNGVDKVSATGSSILTAVIISAVQESQISSLGLTILVSLIVLTIVFYFEERSLLLGAVAVLPVVICVIWITGTMYLVGIPLNVMTITIGALTVGLGITYGIHITHRFLEDIRNEDDLMEASKKTILNTGSALFGAALTTVGGFGLLVFATMPPLQQFGAVTALAIIYSFLSSIVVLPVLLIIWAKGRGKLRERRERKRDPAKQ